MSLNLCSFVLLQGEPGERGEKVRFSLPTFIFLPLSKRYHADCMKYGQMYRFRYRYIDV